MAHRPDYIKLAISLKNKIYFIRHMFTGYLFMLRYSAKGLKHRCNANKTNTVNIETGK